MGSMIERPSIQTYISGSGIELKDPWSITHTLLGGEYERHIHLYSTNIIIIYGLGSTIKDLLYSYYTYWLPFSLQLTKHVFLPCIPNDIPMTILCNIYRNV